MTRFLTSVASLTVQWHWVTCSTKQQARTSNEMRQSCCSTLHILFCHHLSQAFWLIAQATSLDRPPHSWRERGIISARKRAKLGVIGQWSGFFTCCSSVSGCGRTSQRNFSVLCTRRVVRTLADFASDMRALVHVLQYCADKKHGCNWVT